MRVVCSSSRPSAEPAPARADSPREPHLANQELSSRQTVVFDDNRTVVDLYGPDDCNLRLVESELGAGTRSKLLFIFTNTPEEDAVFERDRDRQTG